MKLAEALIERADLQKKIAQLVSWMKQNVKVQEGDEPAEDIVHLMSQYEALMETLAALIVKINNTNGATPLGDMTLAEAIARRDCLKSKLKIYRDLFDESAITHDRYSRSEIKFVRCIAAAKLQGIIDRISKEYRELDVKIQALNWATDMTE
ncbi:MAG: DIP1984 family protein [Christensenellaceae bacterium]|nr:DIP1984 family protein [Christensenellaceae bacterium]